MFYSNTTLRSIRSENNRKLDFAHLNINSIWNEFEFLDEQMKGNVDVSVISEAEIDDSIPLGNFLMEDFISPYRVDCESHGGGIFLFIRLNIPSNLLAIDQKSVESQMTND